MLALVAASVAATMNHSNATTTSLGEGEILLGSNVSSLDPVQSKSSARAGASASSGRDFRGGGGQQHGVSSRLGPDLGLANRGGGVAANSTSLADLLLLEECVTWF